MSTRFVFSLRFRTLMLLFLVVLFGAVVVLVTNQNMKRDAQADAEWQALRIAKLTAGAFEQLIAGTEQFLDAIASDPEVRAGGEETSLHFAGLAGKYPRYTTIALFAASGDMIASALPITDPINVADREWFQDVLRTRKFVVGGYLVGRLSGKPTAAAAVPVLDANGAVRFAVSAGLDLEWINTFVASVDLPENTSVTVFDRDGVVLVRQPDPAMWVGKAAAGSELARAVLAKREEGTLRSMDVDGQPRVFGFAPLTGNRERGPFIAVGIHETVASALADRMLAVRLQTLGLIGGAGLVVIVLVTYMFVWPIRRLVAETGHIASGDFNVRSGLSGKRDEFGDLARSFDTMAAGLQERQRELEGSRLRLAASEEKYHGLYDSLKEGIMMIDMTGRIVQCNYAFRDMLGYTEEEVKSFTQRQLTAEAWRQEEDERIERQVLKMGYSDPYEKEYLRKDGGALPVSARLWLIRDRDGTPKGMWGIVSDITERKRTEKALQASEERLRSTLDGMIEGCMIIDRDFRYVYVNDAAAVQRHGEKKDLMGRTMTETYPGIEATEMYHRLRECMDRGVAGHVENEFTYPDGSKGWFDVRMEPVPEGVLLLSEDITRRKAAEEKVKQTLAELARSNADLEQFAYIASHDLQEPLRTVSGFAQLLDLRYRGRLDKNADEFLDFIVAGTSRMQTLISDLLTYSRVGTRGGPPQPSDCEKVLSLALDNLKAAIKESGAVITHDPLPTITADSSQIAQLFQNLLGNAIKFRKEKEAARIHVSAQLKAGNWLFSVRDNGIGIAPEMFDRLFQLFQRGHPPSSYQGSGIGLAVCKRIIERHGGKIWAESEEGKGSTFYFTIPVRVSERMPEGAGSAG